MASQSPPDVPADADEQRTLASDLAARADESPEQIDATDVETAVALIEAGKQREDFETAVNAAEVFQHVFEQPSLFKPVVDDLIALSDAYPSGVEGIPAPADWFGEDELRAIVYVADALCRATQEDPSIAAPYADALCDVVFGDENAPRHHTFTLGYAATVNPTGVPVSDLRARLETFLGQGHGNGYSSSAEKTLNALDEAGRDGEDSISDIFAKGGDSGVAQLWRGEQMVTDVPVGMFEGEVTSTDVEKDNWKQRVPSRTLAEYAVSNGLNTGDEEAVKAAIRATVILGKGNSEATEFTVLRLGTALARSDVNDISSTLADSIVELADVSSDAVETLIGQYVDALDETNDSQQTEGTARALAMLATRLPEHVTEFDEEIAGRVEHENPMVRSCVVQALGPVVESAGTVSNAVFEALETALNDENDAVSHAARDAAPVTLVAGDATMGEGEQTASGDATASESGPFARLCTVAPPADDVGLRTVGGTPTVVHSLFHSAESGRAYPAVELLDADGGDERSADDASEWRLLTTIDPEADAHEETQTTQSQRSDDASTEADSVVTGENVAERPGSDTADAANADDDGEETRSRIARIPDVSTARPAEDCMYAELTVGDRIGEGGFAEVHEAWLDDDTRLALKKPKQPRLDETLSQSTFDRFAEEAQRWAKLDDDPHVVTMVGWGQTPRPWIAMEYLDGGDLRARLDGDEDFDLAERLWIAAVLAETVANVHHLGVRHLDLKPANILFESASDDDWAVPKIGDWGVAKLQIDAEGDTEALTAPYAAPEQFASGTLDHQTDIYQLGALCYELLTGRTPAEDGVDAANPETSREARPPSALRPALPEGVDEPLRSALAFEKRERYDRAIYLRDALRDAFHDVVEGAPDVCP